MSYMFIYPVSYLFLIDCLLFNPDFLLKPVFRLLLLLLLLLHICLTLFFVQ